MIDDLLAEIAGLGWFLNNCYQLDATLWRVNLRRPDPDNDGDWFTDWSEAPTFEEALEDCIIKMRDAEFVVEPEIRFSGEPAKPKVSLLQTLGLCRPKIERRI